ncbi:unnamed protein product [Bursaphelenchus xylophilus]|uniref:(pine wood nematode) hypothetical protein n=1 Tax=Bursaphelenchus xylophilus TaxID=6326 RepID=A0A1I7S494_BURXY|nr:unnamed protein product [Bursaphelenchus xylophilus]CAG9116858.1 unnamed protein product [Bursaphelenchus xylophilus]
MDGTVPASRLHVSHDYRGRTLRRTSSLQLPNEFEKLRLQKPFGVVVSALSSIKNSTISVYASTLSAVGLLDAGIPSERPLNLYSTMKKYKCCFGICKLKPASAAIGIFSTLYPVVILLVWCYYERQHQRTASLPISLPALLFIMYKVLSSILLLTGLLWNAHYLLIPFMVNLALNIMGSMGLGIFLMLSNDRLGTQLFPAFAICSVGLIAMYLWFLAIIFMTFVLIRDKKRLREGRFTLVNKEDHSGMGRPYIEVPNGSHVFVCKKCRTFVASSDHFTSDAFQAGSGKAFLFRNAFNVTTSSVEKKSMITGEHIVRDIFCAQCNTKIGWMYELAYEESQKYKEGQYILEWAYIICMNNEHDKADIPHVDDDEETVDLVMQRLLPEYIINNGMPDDHPSVELHYHNRMRNPMRYHYQR